MKLPKGVLSVVYLLSFTIFSCTGIQQSGGPSGLISGSPISNNYVSSNGLGGTRSYGGTLYPSRISSGSGLPGNFISSSGNKVPIRFNPEKFSLGRLNANSYNSINGAGGLGRILEMIGKSGPGSTVSYYTNTPEGGLKPIPSPLSALSNPSYTTSSSSSSSGLSSLSSSSLGIGSSPRGQLVRILHQSPTGTTTKLFRILPNKGIISGPAVQTNVLGQQTSYLSESVKPEIRFTKPFPQFINYPVPNPQVIEYNNGIGINSINPTTSSTSGTSTSSTFNGGLSEEDILKIVRSSLGVNHADDSIEIKVLPDGVNYGSTPVTATVQHHQTHSSPVVSFDSNLLGGSDSLSGLGGRTKVFEVVNPNGISSSSSSSISSGTLPSSSFRQIFEGNFDEGNNIQIIQNPSSLVGGGLGGSSNIIQSSGGSSNSATNFLSQLSNGGLDLSKFGRDFQGGDGKLQFLQLVK